MTTENGNHPQRLTSLAGRTQQLASESYTAVKQRLPEAVKPRVEQLEEAVGSAAAPYVHRAQDTGATLLRAADERVDAALTSASKVYTDNTAYLQQQLARQKEFHSANLETYRQAREAYLKKVEDGVEYLKQKGLVGAARDTADEVLARVGEAKAAVLHAPAVLLQKVQEALDRLLAFGPVDRAVQAAKPRLEVARGQYLQYHDKVVASQQYKQAYILANDLATRAQATWLYAKAKQNLLPLAQPAVDTVMASSYYTSLVQHLQPIEAGRA